jgi:CubicO group peptidase (beta-lactamase class C family)
MSADLSERVKQLVGKHAPGVAVLIVGPDGVRSRCAIGVADIVTGEPMTTEHAAPWFSMTKIATATLTVRLAESGAVDLDAPVRPLVPSVMAFRPGHLAEQITLRHLLQHSAGLINPIPVGWIHPTDEPGPGPLEFLDDVIRKNTKLRSEPGLVSRYSNLGSLIVGAALSEATGETFENLVEKHLIEPLGMTATGFAYPPNAPAATGHHPRMNPLRLLLPRWVRGRSSGRWLSLHRFLLDGAPYGGLIGTPEDAARFLQLHLRDGKADMGRIISAAGARAMRDIDIEGKRFDLGLGWFRPAEQRKERPAFVQHLGGGAGFFNVMRIYPKLNVGAVVMGNSTRYDLDSVARLATEGK